MTVSSQSSHHPREVLLAQFSLYVHKSGLKPDSFHLPKPHKSIFAQFCWGILPLRVETGRRQRVRDDTIGQTRSLKLEERVCSIGSSGEVEDEYHFLLKCDVFADIRVDYINKIMRNNADFINLTLEQKFTFLITKCWKETLNFICKAWTKRKTCLYVVILSSSAHCIRFFCCNLL